MEIGINDLYDEEEDDVVVTQPQEETPSQEPQQEDDILSDFLKSRGIEDMSKIQFEDDNGNIEEKSWNSLTREEQINILNTPLEDPSNNTPDLSSDEIELLNAMRSSNLTPSEYINNFRQEQSPQEPQYKVDDLSDEEIFLLDLESRAGELSDEAASEALNNAKQNEELFKKQVDGIRKEYKEREDYQLQQEQAEIEEQQQEEFQKFQDSVINSIDSFNSIGNLDLNFNEQDKEQLAQFMLSRDETGSTYLFQALQDPDILVRAAWFVLNGDEALNNISDYFINQIKLVSENQYKKGFEEGKKGKSPSRPQVVIQQQNNKSSYKSIKDIDNLFDED